MSECLLYLNPEVKNKTAPNGTADAFRKEYVLGYKSFSPPLRRWVLVFDVLLGNSLAGKNAIGPQTHYPLRP